MVVFPPLAQEQVDPFLQARIAATAQGGEQFQILQHIGHIADRVAETEPAAVGLDRVAHGIIGGRDGSRPSKNSRPVSIARCTTGVR